MSEPKLTGSHGCGGSCGCGGGCGENCKCRKAAVIYSDYMLIVLDLNSETLKIGQDPDRYAIINMAKAVMEDRGYKFIEKDRVDEVTYGLRAFISDKLIVKSNGVEKKFRVYGYILCKKDKENGVWLNSETGETVEMRIKSHRVTVQLPGEDEPREVLCGNLYDVYGAIIYKKDA